MQNWPEILVSGTATSRAVSRAISQGKLRKLASRLYTSNLKDAAEAIVRRNLWQITGGYFPGALVADRTALENAPADDGSVYLIAGRSADIDLPGITLRPRKGHPPLASDRPFIGGLYLCSTARGFLENMRPSRARGRLASRTLPRREFEERLDMFLRRSGEDAINRLRDEINSQARELDMPKEAQELNGIIGALLGTREAELCSPIGRARRAGRPYDPARLMLFEALHRSLREYPPVVRPSKKRDEEAQATLAFFEAYFSNFIEGTEFEVEEAADIVFRGFIPSARRQDAHDVLGTYRVVCDPHEAGCAKQFEAFLKLLRYDYAAIMESRRDVRPGEFKQTGNRAGSTTFVAPDLVEGTLEQGFGLCRSLDSPFARAVFMMFLIAEIHPFADGNGRTARVLMNAELVTTGEERIVIPTVYRNNYLAGLKSLSQSGHAEALIRTLDYAQRWTAAVNWSDLESTRRELARCNAFIDPREADEQGIRLLLPARSDAF